MAPYAPQFEGYEGYAVVTAGSDLDSAPANHFEIAPSSGAYALGVQSIMIGFPMDYTTLRGFGTSGAFGGISYVGNSVVLEYITVHDNSMYNMLLIEGHEAYGHGCTAGFGNKSDITVRNSTVVDGAGEGLYIGSNYILTGDGGCPSWGEGHNDILIENNHINRPATHGGQGDGIDIKAGIRNITVRGNLIENGGGPGEFGIVDLGTFLDQGFSTNHLFENNLIRNRPNHENGMGIVNIRGIVIRNNVIFNAKGITFPGTNFTGIRNSNIRLYNNTIYGSAAGINGGSVDGFTLRNNRIAGTSGGAPISVGDAVNVGSDYNVLVQGLGISGLTEGSHSIFVPSSTSQFVNTSTGDLHLTGFTIDFDKVARPQGSGWDIGACEFK